MYDWLPFDYHLSIIISSNSSCQSKSRYVRKDHVLSGSYQAVVKLVIIRVRVRVTSQLSNFLFHLFLHHPCYRAFRLHAIVLSIKEKFNWTYVRYQLAHYGNTSRINKANFYVYLLCNNTYDKLHQYDTIWVMY